MAETGEGFVYVRLVEIFFLALIKTMVCQLVQGFRYSQQSCGAVVLCVTPVGAWGTTIPHSEN